jgi:2-isopropylmalate synthase
MLKRREPNYTPPFAITRYTVNISCQEGDRASAEAMVVVAFDDHTVTRQASGCGPLEALDRALRDAITPRFPRLREFSLIDYKVRILDAASGTRATTRVVLSLRRGDEQWSTVAASSNIIEASCRALVDGIEHGLAMAEPMRTQRPRRTQRRAS